jgi:DNA-binding transcriptional LysR family regulator
MNNTRPDLNLLVVFDAVATCRSVSEAAERLSLSQPAVSHALNRLRDRLGDRLFVRERGGFMPTPRAEAMIGPVRDILAAADRILAGKAFDPATGVRVFRIGASDYSNLALVPNLARVCRRAAPGVRLEMWPVGSETLGELERGELDASFWGATAPEPPWRSQPLFSERMIGLVGAAHPLAGRAAEGRITLDDYLAHPHINLSPKNPGRSFIDVALERLGRERRIAVGTQSFSANLDALTDSDLIAAVPERLAAIARRQGHVVFEIPLDLTPFSYLLIWHQRTDGDPGNVWLRETILGSDLGRV